MERVIVTGGSTEVGAKVVAALRAHGIDVCVVDDLLAPNMRDVFLTFHPETVIHTAFSMAESVAENARFNVLGMLAVLEATRLSGAKHFVFASTTAVEPKPMTLLAVAKLTGERYCTCYRTVHGLDSTVVRLRDDESVDMRVEALLAAARVPSSIAV